ncbi:XK-related protein 9 isoform X4 [Tamandua tetradactyla]|uniref:XK-related protein 9 isoform X4 n=1 Tax=Tamandua tetradactyla TaxID=48850 RepID=UPI0040544C65
MVKQVSVSVHGLEIEPRSPAWKAGVSHLHFTDKETDCRRFKEQHVLNAYHRSGIPQSALRHWQSNIRASGQHVRLAPLFLGPSNLKTSPESGANYTQKTLKMLLQKKKT